MKTNRSAFCGSEFISFTVMKLWICFGCLGFLLQDTSKDKYVAENRTQTLFFSSNRLLKSGEMERLSRCRAHSLFFLLSNRNVSQQFRLAATASYIKTRKLLDVFKMLNMSRAGYPSRCKGSKQTRAARWRQRSGTQLCEKLPIRLFYDLLWRSRLQRAPMRPAMCD